VGQDANKTTLLLVGVGRMGRGMLRGWLKALNGSYDIVALDPHELPLMSEFSGQTGDIPGLSFCQSVERLPKAYKANVVVLATKPQAVTEALDALKGHISSDAVIISVAAGVTIATIKSALTMDQPVVRVMPNIGALVGRSASAAFASPDTRPRQKDLTTTLFKAIGNLTWSQNEDDMHAATAISGSGPAYFFAVCESLISVAVDLGLPRMMAKNLVLTTMAGAGDLLLENPDPRHLRKMVTSPNGTTDAALNVLNADQFLDRLLANTVSAARERSVEMARNS